jgi:hypothetical protein
LKPFFAAHSAFSLRGIFPRQTVKNPRYIKISPLDYAISAIFSNIPIKSFFIKYPRLPLP